MSGTKHRAKGQAFHPCPVYRCVNNDNRYCDIPTTSSLLERSSSSPATINAIRGAEQAGNIAKQWFLLGRCQRLEVSWKQGEGLTIRWVARHITTASRQLSKGNDSKGIQGY